MSKVLMKTRYCSFAAVLVLTTPTLLASHPKKNAYYRLDIETSVYFEPKPSFKTIYWRKSPSIEIAIRRLPVSYLEGSAVNLSCNLFRHKTLTSCKIVQAVPDDVGLRKVALALVRDFHNPVDLPKENITKLDISLHFRDAAHPALDTSCIPTFCLSGSAPPAPPPPKQ